MNIKFTFFLLLVLLTVISAQSYRDEVIITAKHVTRTSTNTILEKTNINHQGVLVYTNKKNIYLIHSMPDTGIVVTKVNKLANWKVMKNLKINDKKTIKGALKSTGYGNGISNYISGGTCIGAVKNIKKYLSK